MSTLPMVRRDQLPEGISYSDEGCEYSPSCLTCPLAECRYDSRPDTERRKRRNERIWRWRLAGLGVTQIARTLNVSTRTVHRILQAGKPENSPSDEARTTEPSSEAAALAVRSIYK